MFPKHLGAALWLLLTLLLAACSAPQSTKPKPQAAELTIVVDGSESTALITSPTYADAAVMRAMNATMQMQRGDSVRILNFGARTAENAVGVLSITSGYDIDLPEVRKRVEDTLRKDMARIRATGGQHATDLAFSLENSSIRCTPRSRVVLLTDGLVQTENYNTLKVLATDQPVHLPPPVTAYLNGCTVEVIGVGMAPASTHNAEMLGNDQVRRLKTGLVEYFKAAGVKPDDIAFVSIL